MLPRTSHLAAGAPTLRFENRFRTKGGDYRWFSWTAVPEGEFLYAVARDITLEKAQPEALRKTEGALRQAQKMEAKGQLTGGVAHDFNNLLTPIVGGLDMLQRKRLGGEHEQRLIAGALQSAERAKTLVQRLLAFARRQPLQVTAVDVGNLVSGMADLIASTSGPQIKGRCGSRRRSTRSQWRCQPTRDGAARPRGERPQRHAGGRVRTS